MTENEAIKIINDKYETFFALSTTNDFDMAMATSIKALEEIQQYRAIGTVEEFKAFRSNDFTQDLLNMGYTKGIKDGYAKAIDEFAERLKDLIAKNVEDAEISDDLCCEIFQSEIDEIAEQMKAGGIE